MQEEFNSIKLIESFFNECIRVCTSSSCANCHICRDCDNHIHGYELFGIVAKSEMIDYFYKKQSANCRSCPKANDGPYCVAIRRVLADYSNDKAAQNYVGKWLVLHQLEGDK